MDLSILSTNSTLLLTLLLVVGLVFFLRASTRDRTEVATLRTEQPRDVTLRSLLQYFEQRAYQVKTLDREQHLLTLEGTVRPSWFLAIFLSLLAGVGLLCLTLVFSVVLPQFSKAFLGLVLLSPLAGLFYWRGAQRVEQISCRVDPDGGESDHPKSLVTVVAHRDELEVLRQQFPCKPLDGAT